MAEERAERRPAGAADQAAEIDTSVAHPARVYDYWLGGSNNFPATARPPSVCSPPLRGSGPG